MVNTVKFRKYVPPSISPQTRNAKKPSVKLPLEYKPPGPVLGIVLKLKIKQSKNLYSDI